MKYFLSYFKGYETTMVGPWSAEGINRHLARLTGINEIHIWEAGPEVTVRDIPVVTTSYVKGI